MSFDKLRRAMEVLERCESVNEVAVLLVLADQYFEATRVCCPTVTLLMEKTRLSRSSVLRAIEGLEEKRLVEVDRRYGARHYFELTLEPQLTLRPGPQPMSHRHGFKREIGFRAKRVRRDNPCPTDMSNPCHTDHNPCHTDIGRTSSPGSVPTATATAPAAPRLPFPIAMKPARPAGETAKLAAAHRLERLRRRVAGYAVGILLDPARKGLALVAEPVTSEALLRAATEELCRRKGVEGYRDVSIQMCASVWWRKSLTGQAVMGGRAPRPRDRGKA